MPRQFLMHRVELKGVRGRTLIVRPSGVPNAPCGVESRVWLSGGNSTTLFLMYRVELKEAGALLLSAGRNLVPNVPCGAERHNTHIFRFFCFLLLVFLVPNVPCGVESLVRSKMHPRKPASFLMYRVELKVIQAYSINTIFQRFLMYRVELKVQHPHPSRLRLLLLCS